MDKVKINTSIQFPFYKITELVTFSEVKKPSGIAYMLLVLISESKDKKANLANTLVNFGVPKNLHYIYAEVIQTLIEQDILSEKKLFQKNQFDDVLISDFAFTNKGKKIFAEESIPTGKNKEEKISLFYDIADNEFSLKPDNDLELKPLMDCALSEEFINQFECKKDAEAYLNLKKGNGISIKKEEVITNVEEIEKEKWIGKYDCEMEINNDSLTIKMDKASTLKFFNTNYTADMFNQMIFYKNKFSFKEHSYADDMDLLQYINRQDINILIPKDVNDILKQKNKLLIYKSNYDSSSVESKIKNQKCLESYDVNCEFVLVDMHDNCFAFIPGVFRFKNDILGIVKIPLVLKIRIDNGTLISIIKPYTEIISDYSIDNFKELVKITEVSKDFNTINMIMERYLTKNVEENIVLLNEIKQIALTNVNILNKYKELLLANYKEYINAVTEDNLETTLKITNNIPSFLGIASAEVLNMVFKSIKSLNDEVKAFELFSNKGYDINILLGYINPVDEVLKGRETNDKYLINIKNYNDSFLMLKDISGIKDYKKLIIDEELINRQDFKKYYMNCYNLKKSISIFKVFNKELFLQYEMYDNIFSELNDYFNKLDEALKNPNNIKKDLIDKKIVSGDYQFVLVNLSAKLEIILKNKFRLNGKLSEMLSEARKNGFIDKKIVNDLHDFRETRNANIHPEDRIMNFDANDLRRWTNEIFELEDKD